MPNAQQPSVPPPSFDAEYWFSAHETADLAAKVEEQGCAFYRRLAAEVENDTVRNMCLFFAEQEDGHRNAFQGISSHFKARTVEFCYSVDIGAMLDLSLADLLALFTPQGNRFLDFKSVVDCLNFALRIEETSVTVYEHMRRTYTERFTEVLTRIVGEEEKHLRMVQDTLSRL